MGSEMRIRDSDNPASRPHGDRRETRIPPELACAPLAPPDDPCQPVPMFFPSDNHFSTLATIPQVDRRETARGRAYRRALRAPSSTSRRPVPARCSLFPSQNHFSEPLLTSYWWPPSATRPRDPRIRGLACTPLAPPDDPCQPKPMPARYSVFPQRQSFFYFGDNPASRPQRDRRSTRIPPGLVCAP